LTFCLSTDALILVVIVPAPTVAVWLALGVVVGLPVNVLFDVTFVAAVLVIQPVKNTVIRSSATSGEISLTAFINTLANSS
jgi:hypothetical protein